jgi:hypothetical protein
VTWREDGHVVLAGPAVLVAEGELWLTGLTPAQAAAAVKDAVGGWGLAWMSDAGDPRPRQGRAGPARPAAVPPGPRRRARRRARRGGRRRRGVLPAAVVRAAWEEGRALVEPLDAARFYAGLLRRAVPRAVRRRPDLPRLVELLERVVDGAPTSACRCSPGWRALPRPDDAAGRAGLLLNVLREHRGSVHAAACAAMGLGPLQAIMAGSYGEANARFFEWPEPYPDPAPYRGRWDAAEDLTSAAAGRRTTRSTRGARRAGRGWCSGRSPRP